MAFIRCCLTTAVLVICMLYAQAQTVYYPQGSSQLLRATAEDAAMLLQKAVRNSQFSVQSYNTIPSSGIIFVYDPAISDNQACKVESDGQQFIRFTAAQDNGLCFGIYQYLHSLGYRFYQPGTIWERIPALSSAYRKTDTIYTSAYKYKSWFISGGHNRWVMDNSTVYNWDNYFGDNGHNWALYQRRNGMAGAYRFAGHRSDVMTPAYLATLQSNPCYVACYDGSRSASNRSVPDVNNQAAMQLWATGIEQKFTQYRNAIFSNTTLYANQYRNFNYTNGLIGVEVPDGSLWGNSTDNSSCGVSGYPKESDQSFRLADFTLNKISTQYPDRQFQVYAYSGHADIPSPSISISNKLDVQVIPTAFQSESSAKGLMNRWYNRHGNISEYHYLNIPQWGGETPMFWLQDMKETLQRIREKKGQGIVWEASPAKFSSLPFLLAANQNLLDGTTLENSLRTFCDDMFAEASGSVYKLFQWWSNDKTVAAGNFMRDNKYRIPLYLQLVNEAVQATRNSAPEVKERIRELKAYLHYMVLYYDWFFDQRAYKDKADKAATLCIYLAKINKLQLVNSYFLILDQVSKFAATDAFYQQYNVTNGTAYQNGALPLVTADEIEAYFQQDLSRYGTQVDQYNFEEAYSIQKQFLKNNLKPLQKINVQLGYTNGFNYPGRAEFYIYAPAAGSFSIQYTPQFEMSGKGYINFTLEETGSALNVLNDVSVDNTENGKSGTLSMNIPSAGTYKLSVVSRFKSSAALLITTNGNSFYKNGPFLGSKTENYRGDLSSLPGYFYVPAGVKKVYFSINNSYSATGGYASAENISKAFVIKDMSGSILVPRLATPQDSSLFYLEVPAGTNGTFLRAAKMEQYNLSFANISNLQWYAQAYVPCSSADFSIAVTNRNGTCITTLNAVSNTAQLEWKVVDNGRTYTYQGKQVELPEYVSPNAVVTLTNGSGCSVSRRIGDDAAYQKAKQACASGAPLPGGSTPAAMVYPNPSTGVYFCRQDGIPQAATEICVTNTQGTLIARFKNVSQFDISKAPAGIYLYRMLLNGEWLNGRLVKL
ncbi:MAG: T9SS type A sorting domain-containing protein [Ferruginibacter sp.]